MPTNVPMTDILTDVRTLLYANPELLAALNGKRVYKLIAPNPKEFPRIILSEVTNSRSDYADDRPMSTDHIIQASIFSKKDGETLAIYNILDPILEAAGWTNIFNTEFFEEDEGNFHRPLRYRIKLPIAP